MARGGAHGLTRLRRPSRERVSPSLHGTSRHVAVVGGSTGGPWCSLNRTSRRPAPQQQRANDPQGSHADRDGDRGRQGGWQREQDRRHQQCGTTQRRSQEKQSRDCVAIEPEQHRLFVPLPEQQPVLRRRRNQQHGRCCSRQQGRKIDVALEVADSREPRLERRGQQESEGPVPRVVRPSARSAAHRVLGSRVVRVSPPPSDDPSAPSIVLRLRPDGTRRSCPGAGVCGMAASQQAHLATPGVLVHPLAPEPDGQQTRHDEPRVTDSRWVARASRPSRRRTPPRTGRPTPSGRGAARASRPARSRGRTAGPASGPSAGASTRSPGR